MSKKPLFTKKHYMAIAELLRNTNDPEDRYNPTISMNGLSFFFSEDNPNFDVGKFVEAVTKGQVTPLLDHINHMTTKMEDK